MKDENLVQTLCSNMMLLEFKTFKHFIGFVDINGTQGE